MNRTLQQQRREQDPDVVEIGLVADDGAPDPTGIQARLHHLAAVGVGRGPNSTALALS